MRVQIPSPALKPCKCNTYRAFCCYIPLRYGTVPIVRETGGLKDTVEPYNEYESTGTGFSFTNYNAHEMLSIVNYAKDVYYNHKREWNKIVDRAMLKDFSWNSSARKYEELYNRI